MPLPPRGPRRRLRRLGRAAGVVAGVGAGLLALAVVARRQLVEVAGPSMEPTLWPGDRLLTLPARPIWLRPGQIVVLEDPEQPGHRIIKRVTALEDRGSGGATQVQVRGDDPARSTDGRRWGAVPATSIRRIAVARWPQVRSPLTRR